MKVVSPGAKDSSEVCKAQGLVASGQSGLRSQPGRDLQELPMCLVEKSARCSPGT